MEALQSEHTPTLSNKVPEPIVQQSSNQQPLAYQQIDLENILSSKDSLSAFTQQFLIIDCRSDLFYQIAHLPEAIHLTPASFDPQSQLSQQLFSQPTKQLLLYSHNASSEEAKRLAVKIAQHFKINVKILKGGWESWTLKQLPASTSF